MISAAVAASSTNTPARRPQERRRSRRTVSLEMFIKVSTGSSFSVAPTRQAISSPTVRWSRSARGSSTVTSG